MANEQRAIAERRMTVFDILQNDHQTVFKIMEELKDAALNEKEGLLSCLDVEIVRHAGAEEKYLYPKLADYWDLKNVMQAAAEDHSYIKALLQKMENVEVESGKWLSHFEALEERLQKHVAIEERHVFVHAAKLVPESELNRIKEEVLAEKEKRPYPYRHRDTDSTTRQV